MKISEVCKYIETFAPPSLQESYDNAGLIVGNPDAEVTNVLIALDVTETVVNDAIAKNANLIVAHHPVIFKGLKRITGKTYTERTVILAIKHDIAIFAAHTNLDSILGGVNTKIAQKLGLQQVKSLSPAAGILNKIVVFVPQNSADNVRQAMFDAGAGHIGNYDNCSYNTEGFGTFRGNENANQFVGTPGELHREPEVKIETIVPNYLTDNVITRMTEAHPYEEVAYDVYALQNSFANVGTGIIGELSVPMSETDFMLFLKKTFQVPVIRHTELLGKSIKKVALCGGSCSFMLNNAIRSGADVYISADFKYHEFFDADGKILITDIGHFESEHYTKEIFYEILSKKFHTFASYLSEINTNPIKYF